jgi:hypothetical protein
LLFTKFLLFWSVTLTVGFGVTVPKVHGVDAVTENDVDVVLRPA